MPYSKLCCTTTGKLEAGICSGGTGPSAGNQSVTPSKFVSTHEPADTNPQQSECERPIENDHDSPRICKLEYLNPDPIVRLVGPLNVAPVYLQGEPVPALLDSGCQVSSCTEALAQHLGLEVHPLEGLELKGVGNSQVPYLGYVEAHLQLAEPLQWAGDILLLVLPRDDTPCILSTQVLYQVAQSVPRAQLKQVPQWDHALRSCELAHTMTPDLEAVSGAVYLSAKVTLAPGTSTVVHGCLKSGMLATKRVHVITENSSARSNAVVKAVACKTVIAPGSRRVAVKLFNPSKRTVTLTKKSVIAQCEPANLVPKAQVKIEATTETKEAPEDGQWLLDKLNLEGMENWTTTEQQAAMELLKQNADLFSKHSLDLGETQLCTHEIQLTDPKPFKEAYRRIPPALYDEVRNHLQEMLDLGAVVPSKSPWASPVVLVRKKDGSLCFCIDLRKLNSRTVRDAYSLPRIEESLESLSGATVFTTLDLKSGYWQVKMDPKSQPYTAFTVGPLGFYECARMPFGLTNAPATFQRLMNSCLGDLQHKFCLLYIDDIVIYSATPTDHLQHLTTVFDRLRRAGLKLKPSKCEFFKSSLEYLGHIISTEGVQTNPKKVAAIRKWPRPTTIAELRSFLGFTGYYRRFIQGYSKIACPLNAHLQGVEAKKKTTPLKWNPASEQAFQQLKRCCMETPVLAYPDFAQPFELHTDASVHGLGAALYQADQRGKKRPVAFASRSLTTAEANYPAHKLEFLALKWAVTCKFHEYLYGQRFTVYTDNNPLTYILSTAKLDAVGHRWVAALAVYHFDIIYKQGKANVEADALSRIKWPGVLKTIDADVVQAVCASVVIARTPLGEPLVLDDHLIGLHFDEVQLGQHVKNMNDADWIAAQDADPALHFIRHRLLDKTGFHGRPPAAHPELKPFWRYRAHYLLRNGVLYRSVTSNKTKWVQLLLPQSHHPTALKLCHDDLGHHGISRTLALLRDRFFWPSMEKDVKRYLASCDRCLRFKPPQEKAKLVHIIANHALELVHFDFLKLEPSKGKFEDVLVVTDHFTRFAQAYPARNQTARVTAKLFWDKFICNYGFPDKLIADQGRNFESHLIKELCNLAHVEKLHTTPYHPQTNGQCERFNRTLISMVGTLDQVGKADWKEHLQALTHAYNCTRSDATGFSPYYLLFGRAPRLPVDVQFGLPPQPFAATSKSKYVQELRRRLRWARQLVEKTNKVRRDRNAAAYDRVASASSLEEGDEVLFRNMHFRTRHKVQDRWSAERFTILSRPDPALPVYRIQSQSTGQRKTVHRNLLLPLHPLPSPAPVSAGEGDMDCTDDFSETVAPVPSSLGGELMARTSAMDDSTPVTEQVTHSTQLTESSRVQLQESSENLVWLSAEEDEEPVEPSSPLQDTPETREESKSPEVSQEEEQEQELSLYLEESDEDVHSWEGMEAPSEEYSEYEESSGLSSVLSEEEDSQPTFQHVSNTESEEESEGSVSSVDSGQQAAAPAGRQDTPRPQGPRRSSRMTKGVPPSRYQAGQ